MPVATQLPRDIRLRPKRRGPRMNSRVPVTIEWTGTPGPLHFESAFTRVVSHYGCLLVSPKEIDVRQALRLTSGDAAIVNRGRRVERAATERRMGFGDRIGISGNGLLGR